MKMYLLKCRRAGFMCLRTRDNTNFAISKVRGPQLPPCFFGVDTTNSALTGSSFDQTISGSQPSEKYQPNMVAT